MLKFKSEDFLNEIITLARQPGCSYIDAIVHYAERNDIEIETLADIIRKNSNLKSKIQDEAEELFLMEKTSKLPV